MIERLILVALVRALYSARNARQSDCRSGSEFTMHWFEYVAFLYLYIYIEGGKNWQKQVYPGQEKLPLWHFSIGRVSEQCSLRVQGM